MRRIVTLAVAATLAVAVLAPIHADARTPPLQRSVIHHLNARAWLSQGVRIWLHPQAPHATGATFTDLVGLPNDNPDQQWAGDPSIVAVDDGQSFIVGSLYFPSFNACGDGNPSQLTVAVSVGTVSGTGTGVSVGDPVVAAK